MSIQVAGLGVNGAVDITGILTADTINEKTTNAGVTIDGALIKDDSMRITERAAVPAAPGAANGTIWLRNDTPNTLMFTDDVGTDFSLLAVASSLANTLSAGNTTGGTDMVMSTGDKISSTDSIKLTSTKTTSGGNGAIALSAPNGGIYMDSIKQTYIGSDLATAAAIVIDAYNANGGIEIYGAGGQNSLKLNATNFEISCTLSPLDAIYVTSTGGGFKLDAQTEINILGLDGKSGSINGCLVNMVGGDGLFSATGTGGDGGVITLTPGAEGGTTSGTAGAEGYVNIDSLYVQNGTIMDSNLNEVLGFTGVASATNYLNITNSTDADPSYVVIGVKKSSGTINPKLEFQNNGGDTILRLNGTDSSVNYLTISSATTSNEPIISATGTDTNITMFISPKGSGHVNIDQVCMKDASIIGFSTFAKILSFTEVASAVNYLDVSSAVTTSAPIIKAAGTDTNIDITITPKGTGNVNITSGGIGFGATPTDYLNYYEEETGTFTFTLWPGAGAIPTAIAYTLTRIGSVVSLKINNFSYAATGGSSDIYKMDGAVSANFRPAEDIWISTAVVDATTISSGFIFVSTVGNVAIGKGPNPWVDFPTAATTGWKPAQVQWTI